MWRFFKDFIIYGFASILGKLMMVLLMPIYTSILTKEEYGAMALIFSCQGIIDLFSNLNLHSGIARDYYENDTNRTKLISSGFYAILAISLSVVFVTLMGCKENIISYIGLRPSFILPLKIMVITTPFLCLTTYFSILTRFKKKPISFSLITSIALIVQLSISIAGVVYLRAGIISVFLGHLISSIITALLFGYINREYLALAFEKKYVKKALLFSLPTLPAILAGWLDTSVGQILIGKYVSVEELGVYSIAISLASIFTLISTAFHNVWSPFLYENYKKETFQNDLNKLFSIITCGLTCITIVISMFSKEIILLLSNEGYLNASIYFPLLCIPMCLYLMFPFVSSGVSISRDTKYIGISYVLGSVSNLLILLILIRRLGVIAVPICLSVSRIVTYFTLYYVSKIKIGYYLNNYYILLLIISAIACFWAQLNDVGLVWRSIASGISLFLIIYNMSRKYKISYSMFKMNNNTKMK